EEGREDGLTSEDAWQVSEHPGGGLAHGFAGMRRGQPEWPFKMVCIAAGEVVVKISGCGTRCAVVRRTIRKLREGRQGFEPCEVVVEVHQLGANGAARRNWRVAGDGSQ